MKKSTLLIISLLFVAVVLGFDWTSVWPNAEATKKEFFPSILPLVPLFFAWFVHWRSLHTVPNDVSEVCDEQSCLNPENTDRQNTPDGLG